MISNQSEQVHGPERIRAPGIDMGALQCRLVLAQTALMFGQSMRERRKAMAEIEAIRGELKRREKQAGA